MRYIKAEREKCLPNRVDRHATACVDSVNPEKRKGGIAMRNAFLNALFLGLIALVLIAVWAFNAINRKRDS